MSIFVDHAGLNTLISSSFDDTNTIYATGETVLFDDNTSVRDYLLRLTGLKR